MNKWEGFIGTSGSWYGKVKDVSHRQPPPSMPLLGISNISVRSHIFCLFMSPSFAILFCWMLFCLTITLMLFFSILSVNKADIFSRCPFYCSTNEIKFRISTWFFVDSSLFSLFQFTNSCSTSQSLYLHFFLLFLFFFFFFFTNDK